MRKTEVVGGEKSVTSCFRVLKLEAASKYYKSSRKYIQFLLSGKGAYIWHDGYITNEEIAFTR